MFLLTLHYFVYQFYRTTNAANEFRDGEVILGFFKATLTAKLRARGYAILFLLFFREKFAQNLKNPITLIEIYRYMASAP
jgi:hypothetical protein